MVTDAVHTTEIHLKFEGALTSKRFDECCSTTLTEKDSENKRLIVDISKCSFIELSALFGLLSMINLREKRALETKIRIPEQRLVRDFIRLSGFPDIVAKMTGKKLHRFVHQDDLKYFKGRGGDAEPGTYDTALPISKLRFPFVLWKPPEMKEGWDTSLQRSEYYFSAVEDQDRKWAETVISSVLKNLFRDPSYLISDVVYEALSNAFRHPESENICFSSNIFIPKDSKDYLDRDSKSAPGTFSLCYWDDGQSIYQTLQGTDLGDVSVSANRRLKVILNCEAKRSGINVTKQIDNLKKKSFKSPIDVFLAAFLPGTTRDGTGQGQIHHSSRVTFEPDSTLPGYGLHNLIQGTCMILGGGDQKSRVAVRSGRLFALVRGDQQLQKKNIRHQVYNVEVDEIPCSSKFFQGNLVSIQLPVRVPKRFLRSPKREVIGTT